MSKFSGTKRRPLRTNLTAPIRTTRRLTRTHEAGDAYLRDPESELFLLAATNMVGEDTFYERAADRDARFVDLVHTVTESNPAFIAGDVDAGKVGLAQYLRESMLMRSAPVVLAAEYVAAGGARGRSVVDRALQRPDEPAEMLGYWLTRHGRNIPMPIKRGVADAARRLYTERAALRYDRPVPPDPHGRRHRAHPPQAPRRPPVGAVPVAARPSPPRRRRRRPRRAAGPRRCRRARRGGCR